MRAHTTKIRIRYGETDKMGFVYYGNYAQYLEVGRVEWLRALGVSYKDMEVQGIMLPVVSLHVNYKKSAYYDDVICITTRLVKLPTAKIEFDYEIKNENNDIITLANTCLVFIDMNTQKPIRCPQFILDKLQN